MSRDIAPFGLRMRAELKDQLEHCSKENKRSLNAEIVSRLEGTLKSLGDYLPMKEANERAMERRIEMKDLILKKNFEDISKAVQLGQLDTYTDLDEFQLENFNDKEFNELLEPTFKRLEELGYEFRVDDCSSLYISWKQST